MLTALLLRLKFSYVQWSLLSLSINIKNARHFSNQKLIFGLFRFIFE